MASNRPGQKVENVKVKINGQEMQQPGVLGGQNSFSTQTINTGIPAAPITIEFDAISALNEGGYRIDNIKLVGTK